MNVRKYIWNTDLHQPETNLESIRLELKCCIYLTRTSSNKDVCVNTAFGSILAFLCLVYDTKQNIMECG